MMNTMWIPLTQYSLQNNVSISTLRRRIKSHTIQFKLEAGKYFIWQEAAGPKSPQVIGIGSPISEMADTNDPAPQNALTQTVLQQLLNEKERRIELLEQHIRVLHQENEALSSLVKMLEE